MFLMEKSLTNSWDIQLVLQLFTTQLKQKVIGLRLTMTFMSLTVVALEMVNRHSFVSCRREDRRAPDLLE